ARLSSLVSRLDLPLLRSPAATDIFTLSLHDALPIYAPWFRNFCLRLLEGSPDVLALMPRNPFPDGPPKYVRGVLYRYHFGNGLRSEEHTSELQSHLNLVCRLLLEKKTSLMMTRSTGQ